MPVMTRILALSVLVPLIGCTSEVDEIYDKGIDTYSAGNYAEAKIWIS